MSKTEDGKLTRIGFDPKLPEFLPLWAKANGASIISDDGKTSQLEDPKVIEALQYAVSLVTDQAPGARVHRLQDERPWRQGLLRCRTTSSRPTRSGAMPMEQWYLNVLANNSPDEKISFAPFKDRQGNAISLSGGSALAIPASAKNKDAACEYIRVHDPSRHLVRGSQGPRRQARGRRRGVHRRLQRQQAGRRADLR